MSAIDQSQDLALLRRELNDNVSASLSGARQPGRDFSTIAAELEAAERPRKADR